MEEVSSEDDIRKGNTSVELSMGKGATKTDVLMVSDENMKQGDTRRVIDTDDTGGDMGDSKSKGVCTFKKGTCVVHKLKGKKMTQSSKFWTKKKDGMYGWSYRKKVTYECEYGPSNDL